MIRHLGRLGLAVFVGSCFVAAWMTYRIWDTGNRDDRRPADAIVVLGAAQYNGRPSTILRSRVEHAIDLYEAGLAKWFVVTGGKADGDLTTEAATARDLALKRGVPASAILVEDQGRTTLTSLRRVADLLHDNGLQTALFVSDRTHMLRVLKIAGDEGIEAYGSPTDTSPTDATVENRLEATVHELGGLALYFLAGQAP
ncbi:MAG TPA: YdcF family protein [Candidatus Limnocylindrales bacterium]|nr:YdcF family protein [Candidatus Limnocylindrales bacterium]